MAFHWRQILSAQIVAILALGAGVAVAQVDRQARPPVATSRNALPPAADSGETFAAIAKVRPRSAGAPKAADVCFSTRTPNPGKRDSLKAVREFHATRVDWLYLTGKAPFDKAFVARLKAAGCGVGGTVNCQLTDAPDNSARTFSIGRTVNTKGDALSDPWTKHYGGRFGCPNNPEYAKVFLSHARYALDAGVDYFQMDGVQLNELMAKYGGCFCTHCVKGFREYLGSHSTPGERAQWGIIDLSTFDYARFLLDRGSDPNAGISAWKGPQKLRERFRDFQVESGLRFLSTMYRQIDRMAGRKLAYSCNANEEFLTTYHTIHDFAFNETYPAKEGDPAFLYEHRLKPAMEMGKSFLMTFVSHDVAHNRRFIASSYALGANVVVPWDVFTGLGSPRFYGTPEQFADLYGFIRANASLLEGYEEAGVFGPGIRDPRYAENQPPLQVYAESPMLAVVRAKPGSADAPVVVHLVAAESDKTGPVRVTFDPRRFFGGRPLRIRFEVPPPYVAMEHEKAESTRDFGPLSRTIELPGGCVSMVELPAVEPWGILVVEPSRVPLDFPWQPAVWCDEQSRFREALHVHLDCATPGAMIRYTLDGSEPTDKARPYQASLKLDASATLKAKAFAANGSAGPLAMTRFEKGPGHSRLFPDAAALKTNLKLWLKADTLSATLEDGAPVNKWPAVVGPDAAVPSLKLLSGAAAGAPTFGKTLLNGHPGVRFDGVDDLLSIRDFANTFLAGKSFTVFLVTRSMDPSFGASGNAANGSGGIPRLYLMRGTFRYDRPDGVSVGAGPGTVAVTVYQHDGQKTASARSAGRAAGQRDDLPVVDRFGGGSFAIPLWTGYSNHAGELGEVIAYDRKLTDAEVEAIEEYLRTRFDISDRLRWR